MRNETLSPLAIALALVGPMTLLCPEPCRAQAPVPDGMTADPEPSDPGAQRVAAQIGDSVALVWCGDARSGTAISVPGGRLVTAAHVARCPRSLQVETSDGTRTPARVLSFGEPDDIALLAPEDELGLTPLPLRASVATAGLRVHAAGYPVRRDAEGRVSVTITSGVVGQVQEDIVYSDVAVGPGTSGGPLLDARAHLVGVLFARPYESGVALAVPSARVRALYAGSDDDGGDARSLVSFGAGVSLGVLANRSGGLVGPRLDVDLSLQQEWTLRASLGVYLGSDRGSPLEERTSTLSQGGLEIGYRLRFELGEGAALTLEPTLGVSVGYEETRHTSYPLMLADPGCDPLNEACAFQPGDPFERVSDRWLVRPTLGIRLGVLDALHIGYQFQLDVENPEDSSHLVTFGVEF